MFVCLWTYNPHYPFEAPGELTEHYRGKEGPGLKNPIYGAQIEATDHAVGRVLNELDSLGIRDETMVVFTSDNGGWSGATDNRPLREGKGHLFEGGLRVPLIVRWPKVTEAGTVNETPVISMDLTATILDAAGVNLASGESLDGDSLRPLFGGGKLEREALYFHYPHFAFHKANRPGSVIRSGQYKLILRHEDDSVELFDLEADLSETKNLATVQPELAQNLRDRLREWLRITGAGIPKSGQDWVERYRLPNKQAEAVHGPVPSRTSAGSLRLVRERFSSWCFWKSPRCVCRSSSRCEADTARQDQSRLSSRCIDGCQ